MTRTGVERAWIAAGVTLTLMALVAALALAAVGAWPGVTVCAVSGALVGLVTAVVVEDTRI